MAKTVKDAEPGTAEQALAELRAAAEGGKPLTFDEWLALRRRLPKIEMPEGWSSADDIRELRGPLPEDDPDVQRNSLGRR
jgi:hypothetical protein